jgi:redox-sensitive bicupin YhaK (pirin superfamily)
MPALALSCFSHASTLFSLSSRLRYLQAWIKPDGRGYTPIYASRQNTKEARHNRLQQVASGRQRAGFNVPARDRNSDPGILCIRQDANIFVSEADPGGRQVFTLERVRQAYLVCIEGCLSVNGVVMEQRDALEVSKRSLGCE